MPTLSGGLDVWSHLELDVKTGQVRAALMTHQHVDDTSASPGLLAQFPPMNPSIR